MITYLLHFEHPIGDPANPRGQARHYCGCCENLEKRLRLHRKGQSGSSIVRAFHDQGIHFQLARIWEGGRDFERRLKNRKNAPKLCPICQDRKMKQLELIIQ